MITDAAGCVCIIPISLMTVETVETVETVGTVETVASVDVPDISTDLPGQVPGFPLILNLITNSYRSV